MAALLVAKLKAHLLEQPLAILQPQLELQLEPQFWFQAELQLAPKLRLPDVPVQPQLAALEVSPLLSAALVKAS